MPSILALDLGTTTGWALLQPDDRIVSGAQCFRQVRSEGVGMRFVKMRNWLAELKAGQVMIGAVFYEDVRRHVGTDAAHAYGGFLATLTSWCEHHHIPYSGISVGKIKKHYTGSGAAKKDAMVQEAQRRGFTPVDDNEADALAILDYAVQMRLASNSMLLEAA